MPAFEKRGPLDQLLTGVAFDPLNLLPAPVGVAPRLGTLGKGIGKMVGQLMDVYRIADQADKVQILRQVGQMFKGGVLAPGQMLTGALGDVGDLAGLRGAELAAKRAQVKSEVERITNQLGGPGDADFVELQRLAVVEDLVGAKESLEAAWDFRGTSEDIPAGQRAVDDVMRQVGELEEELAGFSVPPAQTDLGPDFAPNLTREMFPGGVAPSDPQAQLIDAAQLRQQELLRQDAAAGQRP